MIILAIETSCDDTCVAIIKVSGKIKPCFQILSNITSSQIKIHRKWGGVYPTLAKREHQKNLPTVLKKALKKAGFAISNFKPAPYRNEVSGKGFPISKQIPKTKLKIPKIDVIAVTIGPGLEPCLWVGVNSAKELARKLNLPIIPINHIEAHILVNWLDNPQIIKYKIQDTRRKIQDLFPSICLIASGGHTQLILMKNFRDYKILGETRDDAAGECFDKIARILGLDYPGGPAIAAQAAKFQASGFKFQVKLPRPMIYQKNYDFSFSGLKTAVLYNWRSQSPKIRKSKKYIQAMSAEAQQAVIDVLIHKTIKAAKDYRAKTVILGGGVTANDELRKQFKAKIKKEIPYSKFYIPNSKLCTDNAAMIGATAYFHWPRSKKSWQKIEAKASLRL